MLIKKSSFLVGSALLLLSGCVTTPEYVTGPDGTPHKVVSCSRIEDCYQEAAEVCGGKYKIVNTSNEVSGKDGKTSTTNNLLVKCQGPSPQPK